MLTIIQCLQCLSCECDTALHAIKLLIELKEYTKSFQHKLQLKLIFADKFRALWRLYSFNSCNIVGTNITLPVLI